ATAMPALTPPVSFGNRPRGAAAAGAARPAVGPPRVPPVSTAFGASRPIYFVASDGKLHLLNTSTGVDQSAPLPSLPAGAKASPLTIMDITVYTTTSGCGGRTSGVCAIDLNLESPTPASFPLKGAEPSGVAGLSLGSDGTVYVATGAGETDPASD